jgi:hypothetical protein
MVDLVLMLKKGYFANLSSARGAAKAFRMPNNT